MAATTALFAACERAGIKRAWSIFPRSAQPRRSASTASKPAARPKPRTTFRGAGWIGDPAPAGLVLAPTVYGGTAMLREAQAPARSPRQVLEPDARIQVVSVEDVAQVP